MKELIRYLLQHLVVDFEGEISAEVIRQYLKAEDSRESKILLAKLVEDRGVDDLLVTIADCLKDHLATGITETVMRDQLVVYSDS